MSLELNIKALTEAVNALTTSLNANRTIETPLPTAKEVEAIVSPELLQELDVILDSPVTLKELTSDDLKDKCLSIARTVEGGKDKAKAVLKEFRATKVADVKASDRQAVMDKLGAL
jgi:hypothetical protein